MQLSLLGHVLIFQFLFLGREQIGQAVVDSVPINLTEKMTKLPQLDQVAPEMWNACNVQTSHFEALFQSLCF